MSGGLTRADLDEIRTYAKACADPCETSGNNFFAARLFRALAHIEATQAAMLEVCDYIDGAFGPFDRCPYCHVYLEDLDEKPHHDGCGFADLRALLLEEDE